MALKDLTREQAIALIERIASGLQTTEDAGDFCIWLSETLQRDAGISVDLASECGFAGGVSREEFAEHMFQASLPDSDPRKRD